MSSLINKLLEIWSNTSYTELFLAFLAYQFIKFYYKDIYKVHYTGKISHLPQPHYPLYHHFYRYYLRFFGDIADYAKVHEKYGSVFVSASNVVLTSNLEAFKLLNSYQIKKGRVYSSFDLSNPTIFSSRERQYHAKRKRLISPAFNVKSMLSMEPKILKIGTLNLLEFLQSQFNAETKQIKVNIIDTFYQSTLDVISELVFGQSLNTLSEDASNFKFYMREVQKIQWVLGMSPLFPFLKKYYPAGDIFKKMIVENMERRRLEKSENSDILQSLMDTQDDEIDGGGGGLRDDEIIDEAITLLFAGIDTTSNTLIFTIYEILKDRDLYNRITDQILKEFPDPNAKITVEECRTKLTLLEASLLESMRYRPIAFGLIPRVVPKGGIMVDGHYIPEDVSYVVYFKLFSLIKIY
jgi:cytochrome P450